MTNISAAVLTLTFGPVFIAIFAIAIFNLLTRIAIAGRSLGPVDSDVDSAEATVVVKQPTKRWESKGISFEPVTMDLDGVTAPKGLITAELVAKIYLLAEGPREYEKHFTLIAKAHKRGGSKERGLHKAIVRKAGGRSFKKVCVLHSNMTGLRYAAYFENGKKYIYNAIDWK